jgi:hypothetical protein
MFADVSGVRYSMRFALAFPGSYIGMRMFALRLRFDHAMNTGAS